MLKLMIVLHLGMVFFLMFVGTMFKRLRECSTLPSQTNTYIIDLR